MDKAAAKIMALLFGSALLLGPDAIGELPPVDPRNLEVDAPFGVDWDMSKSQLNRLSKEVRRACMNHPGHQSRSEKRRRSLCKPDKNWGWTLPQFSDPENRVWVKLGWENGWRPATVAYSYLYRTTLPSPEDRDLRDRQARAIAAQLSNRYGRPIAIGSPVSYPTLSFELNKDGSCSIWLEGKTAILLCPHRNLHIDAFEMSLMFVRLDRARRGGKMLRALETAKASVTDAGAQQAE